MVSEQLRINRTILIHNTRMPNRRIRRNLYCWFVEDGCCSKPLFVLLSLIRSLCFKYDSLSIPFLVDEDPVDATEEDSGAFIVRSLRHGRRKSLKRGQVRGSLLVDCDHVYIITVPSISTWFCFLCFLCLWLPLSVRLCLFSLSHSLIHTILFR